VAITWQPIIPGQNGAKILTLPCRSPACPFPLRSPFAPTLNPHPVFYLGPDLESQMIAPKICPPHRASSFGISDIVWAGYSLPRYILANSGAQWVSSIKHQLQFYVGTPFLGGSHHFQPRASNLLHPCAFTMIYFTTFTLALLTSLVPCPHVAMLPLPRSCTSASRSTSHTTVSNPRYHLIESREISCTTTLRAQTATRSRR